MSIPIAGRADREGGMAGAAAERSGSGWAGLIPAAGESRRMGRLKPLLPFGPTTVIERVIATAAEAGLAPIAVVLGHRAEEIAAVLPAGCVRIENPEYRAGGMLSSIRRGLASLPPVEGAVLLLADQPLAGAAVVRRLLGSWDDGGRPADRVYVPAFEGRRGHPIAIPCGLFASILAWRGEGGLRGFLRERGSIVREVPVGDRDILIDIDAPEDYARALEDLHRRGRRAARPPS
ncbi:MAG: nucleotidyltransferase family protein [Planctomycetes bacterium]|nr:nucleotidyltransferase family protein [Planctomycetota bacterium]